MQFEQRVAALATFRQLMSLSDAGYSSAETLRGCAGAVEGIFPGIRHMCVMILADPSHTNNYTLIGEGAMEKPRRHVPVAKNTLVQYVIRKCLPVFLDNCEAADIRTFADVQFLRFILKVRV